MAELIYCQKLWEQYAKVEEARKISAAAMDVAIGEGRERLADFIVSIERFELELQSMRETWEGMLETLDDGRKIFILEMLVLEEVLQQVPIITKSNFMNNQVIISEDNLVIGLKIPYERIHDISMLSKLRSLQTLSLNHAQINNILPLRDMAHLREFEVNHTMVGDIEVLADKTELEVLDLSDTLVIDIAALKNFNKLQNLNLARTKVKDIEVIERPQSIRFLNLDSTNVTNFDPLKNFESLEGISLYATAIDDLSPFLELKKLKRIFIQCTPAAEDPEQQKLIETLRACGVEVHV